MFGGIIEPRRGAQKRDDQVVEDSCVCRRAGQRSGRPRAVGRGAASSTRTGTATSAQIATAQAPTTPQRALVNRYCVTCHNANVRRGDLRLDTIDLNDAGKDAATLEKVVRKLRAGMMPPAGVPRPDKATYDGLTSWLETELDRAAASHPNPGRTEALHRLNRTEYQNAIRDLLGLEIRVAELLPADDQSFGFDNIAGVLGVSPTLLERYRVGRVEHCAARGRRRRRIRRPRRSGCEATSSRTSTSRDCRSGRAAARSSATRFRWPATTRSTSRCRGRAPSRIGWRSASTARRPRCCPLEPAAVVPNVDGELMSDAPPVRITVNGGAHDVGVTFVKKSSIVADGVRQPFLRPYNNQLSQPVVELRDHQRPDEQGRRGAGRHAEPSARFSCASRSARRTKRRAPARSSRSSRGARIAARSPPPTSRSC